MGWWSPVSAANAATSSGPNARAAVWNRAPSRGSTGIQQPEGRGEPGPGLPGRDDRVDQPRGECALRAQLLARVAGGQRVAGARGIGRPLDLAPAEDAHRLARGHDPDLRARPGEREV